MPQPIDLLTLTPGIHCLSIRQPWASLIIHGVKRIENRTWPAPASLIGQRIAIHASASACQVRSWSDIFSGPPIPADESVCVGLGLTLPPLATLPRGVIVGTVLLKGCKLYDELPPRLRADPFAEPGGFCWLLAEPQRLDEPIACKGALRLWRYSV